MIAGFAVNLWSACPHQIPEAPAKASETSVPPAPSTDPTPTSTGTSGGPCTGSKTRTGSRSSPRTGSRLQNASKSGSAAAVAADRTGPAKPSQSKEQAEKRNQAISQLRRLLVQGNRRVEALATVIQHLFTEVLELLFFLCWQKTCCGCSHCLCTNHIHIGTT